MPTLWLEPLTPVTVLQALQTPLLVNKPLMRWTTSQPHFTMCLALPWKPRVHGGGASCLGKNARGLEWPGLGNGLAIVPQEKVIRKWNLDQLTAGFVQGRVGQEKCFWKFFHFLCWGHLNPFLQKHAGGDHISFWRKMHGRGVKWYLLKEKKSIGNVLFDKSTKPNIQGTVSVYRKCHF